MIDQTNVDNEVFGNAVKKTLDEMGILALNDWVAKYRNIAHNYHVLMLKKYEQEKTQKTKAS